MPQSRVPELPTWPVSAAELVYGLVEWVALTRSRASDVLQQARHRLKRG